MCWESRISSTAKMISNTLFVLTTFFTISFSCKFNIESSSVVCTSLEELNQVNHLQNWKKIDLKPSKSVKLLPFTGNYVRNVPNLEELNLQGVINDYISSSSFVQLKNLKKINIKNNSIPEIQSKVFENSNVREISLIWNEIKNIQPGAFSDLPKIEIISIIGNDIFTIQTNVFTKLPVRELILSNNKIQFIENRAFAEMHQLKVLKLDQNKLTGFDTKLILDKSPSLNLLMLSKNNLKSITKDMFQSLDNLKYLLLNNNQLEIVANNCFYNLKTLKTLDISTNNIKEISSLFFPQEGAQMLTNLYIHNNQLCFLSPEVFKKLPNIRKFSYGGNPWQCPCWESVDKWITNRSITRMCHEEYVAGQRPECVITDFAPSDCIYDKEKLNEIPGFFFNEVQVYGSVKECLIDLD